MRFIRPLDGYLKLREGAPRWAGASLSSYSVGQRWHRATSASECALHEWLAGSVAVRPMLPFRSTEVFDGR